MSTRSQLTKDLNESVKSLLGKHVKILLKNVVKLETKPDKLENRVLVFSPCRLFLLTAKVPTRIDCHFHYLEISSVESKRANQLSLTVGERIYNFVTMGLGSVDTSEVDAMIEALHTAIRNIFPTVPLNYVIRKIDVIPVSRLQSIRGSDLARSTEATRHTGPCGGFSTQYACMCDLHNVPYREEVAWDVDTIYLSHDTRELDLRDFDHLDQKDLVPIISALEYNTWFTKLCISHLKLNHEPLDRLLHVLKRSLSIQEIYLDNIGVKWDFAHKLSLALIANTNAVLHTIDLSSNTIEDKGASSLCGAIAKLTQGTPHTTGPLGKLPKGLQKLNLARCGLTGKGVGQIAHALSLNRIMPTSLQYLNLAENTLKDDINNLCSFLAQPNGITHLDLSGTETTLECLFGALLRGCATNLVHLNVARNSFSSKKTKEIPPSFKQFFTASKYLNISFCKLPLEALKHLLLGLACNESTVGLELDMSGNNLGSMGAHVLESCIHGVRCIASLDISDSNMDVDLAQVITAIGKNKSIKQVYMGRNTLGMKSKHIAVVMDSLVQMLQEEDCVLQALHLPDSRLKADLYNLINALGSNACLRTLDICGNQIGDPGARLLAKALQINNHLKTIVYDRNNISLQGYADIVHALERNYSVRHMPCPIHDLQPCMKASAEKTEQLTKKIQDLLQRNVAPCRNSHGQAFRLQQGFLLSSTQHMVDRLVVQTQDTIKAIAAEICNANNDINYATGLIRDADNSKQLLPRLHEVLQRRDENNPVETKLAETANQIHKVVSTYLQDSLDTMLKCASEQCPTILEQTVVNRDDDYDDNESLTLEKHLRNSCKEKNKLTLDFIHSTITEQAGADIINRVNELNLVVAAHISDRITDQVIESLSTSYKSLIGECEIRTRSSTPDVLRPSAGSTSSTGGSVIGVGTGDMSLSLSTGTPVVERISLAMDEEDDRHSDERSLLIAGDSDNRALLGKAMVRLSAEDESPLLEYLNLATPHLSNKRKSLHGRKLRPKSVVDSVEGLSADDIPDLLPSSSSSLPKGQQGQEGTSENEHSLTESLDSVSELPSNAGVGQQLQHLVKSRPRRTKTRAPTRPMLRPDQSHSNDGIALGEGLDVFFRPTTPTTPIVGSPTSDDSSLNTFPTMMTTGLDSGSPSLSTAYQKGESTIKKNAPNTPMLKNLHTETSSRSRSSDDVAKFSPLVGRRSHGDSPLTASPLTRRSTIESTKCNSEKIGQEVAIAVAIVDQAGREEQHIILKYRSEIFPFFIMQMIIVGQASMTITDNSKEHQIGDSSESTGKSVISSVRRFTAAGHGHTSPTNGNIPKNYILETAKSPVLRSLTTKNNQQHGDRRSPPTTAPKPRPWSMAADRKSGEFNQLLSDGSSPNTSAGNTPDSGDALDESTDSGICGPASLPPSLTASCIVGSSLGNTCGLEKRSVRELAASLSKGGNSSVTSSQSKINKKENEHSTAWRSVLRRYVDPSSSTQSTSLKVQETQRETEPNRRLAFKLRRTSFLRDSNFNYDNDTVDV
ncbi:PREDICTED: leucine-rich repeat-containing protein 16A [Ceratosolen solmsi marchali]|uniref:Leucine-rich repeat-containing protein 16A n=1 Tax=Ceratosolen solmsi marchali TaxID=326594 RepID=A0AAJ6VJF8_9HYME|nr:PREDICTED: leucine-rich repeat-containing protein 16A [Ceratosolen solmsi marchali]